MNAIRAIHPDRHEGLWVFGEGQRSGSGDCLRAAETIDLDALHYNTGRNTGRCIICHILRRAVVSDVDVLAPASRVARRGSAVCGEPRKNYRQALLDGTGKSRWETESPVW